VALSYYPPGTANPSAAARSAVKAALVPSIFANPRRDIDVAVLIAYLPIA